MRLDLLLTEKGLAQSREKAKAMIMSGMVYVANQKADKPGTEYPLDSAVEVRGEKLPYVSRGGLKLEKGLKEFKVSVRNLVCMDIGASTGGFTDCMLQNGARKVYAVDVGYGQLAWKLRENQRVVNLEKTNIRHLEGPLIEEPIAFFSVDVAFISLGLVLPKAFEVSAENVESVCLVKPQFEAGREKVGKKGVVRDGKVHLEVLKKVREQCGDIGFFVKGASFSPITGPNGNIEFLYHLTKQSPHTISDELLEKLVTDAHIQLQVKEKEQP